MKARAALPLLALLAALPLPWVQGRIDAELGTFRAQQEVLYLWSGTQVKRMVPGFEGLAASIYWLRTVQYFGGQRLFARDKRFELLEPLIDITTTLDPRLEVAYRYGAIFLCEPPPVGAGRPHNGIGLLERGARALPESWRLRQDLGFFHFLYLHDVETASRILYEASNIPGAAFWLKTLAGDLLLKKGDRGQARAMWKQMYDQAEGGILRTNAERQLVILDTLDQADRLTAAAHAFSRAHGRLPHDLKELAASGLARDPVVDANRIPFDYDQATGRVRISTSSSLWRPDLRYSGE
ncbi:MAG TPA: hypothetical protein VIC87_08575 [Vicinamibacteria bacterium]